jgi:hypothetical protein
MKRIVMAVLCLALIGTAGFSLDKAAGGGLLLGYTFQGGSEENSNLGGFGGGTFDWTFNRTSFGGFGFFGLGQYVELNAAFMYKTGEASVTWGGNTATSDFIEPTAALGFGAYGKYPFPISDKVVIFPTAGLDFEFNLHPDWVDDAWNDLWLRLGAGVDYFFTDTIFLRSHFIYGLVLPLGSKDLNPDPGHGFLLKVGVGKMF